MKYHGYINLGLEDSEPLKIIMCGNIQNSGDEKNQRSE